MKINRISNNFRNHPLHYIAENAFIDTSAWSKFCVESLQHMPKFNYSSEMRALQHFYLRIVPC
ncbi:g008 [Yersinia phage phiR1-37]|uniref:hypothetical protein n=1 Tax=Yersinia phage phiR1-37 TaxID=331278 RepID=UPI00022DBCB4|nr:hypothetical protein phiR1-37_gp008 [Yersinia phage phiR1-37]CCE26032.1 g008 [Yersinia phage phiR1-37]